MEGRREGRGRVWGRAGGGYGGRAGGVWGEGRGGRGEGMGEGGGGWGEGRPSTSSRGLLFVYGLPCSSIHLINNNTHTHRVDQGTLLPCLKYH